MADFLVHLCGTDPSDPFPLWVTNNVGHCFNQLVLNALPHALLAVVSACYWGGVRFRRNDDPSSHRWICRITASFLLAALSIADLVATMLLPAHVMLYLEVLADGVSALAWLSHGLGLMALASSMHGATRGPPTLAAVALLPAPALVITLAWYCQNGAASAPPEVLGTFRLVIISLQLLLLLTYFIAFLIPISRRDQSFSINEEVSERTPLLQDSAPNTAQITGEDGESWLSRIFYLWLNPLLQRGRHGQLNCPGDVYLLPCRLCTVSVCSHFDACLQKCQEEKSKMRAQEGLKYSSPDLPSHNIQNGRWSGAGQLDSGDDREAAQPGESEKAIRLFSVLHKAFGLRYYSLGLLKLAGNMLGFAGPILLNLLVSFMESPGQPLRWGIWYALGLFASSLLGGVLRNQFTYEVMKVVVRCRASVISAIYRKALRVNSTTLSRFSAGEIVNFMSTDTDRLANFFPSFHEVWSLPFQFAITLYLLYQQVGVAFLGGLGLALLLVPVNKVIATRIMENNKELLKHKDLRVKMMTEILFGMRVIKFYTWEKHFAAKIAGYRRRELDRLKVIKYLDAVCVYLWAALPVVISILTFITYVLLGHQLTAAKVFTALALVGMLILPLNSFPWVLNGTLEAKVSLDRIQRFLELSDQDLSSYYSTAGVKDAQSALELHHATFSWLAPSTSDNMELPPHKEDPKEEGILELSDLSLHVRKGMLVGVVGKVGCGKSSLIAAITGELSRRDGVVYISTQEQGFGLATQEPWIQHASVRENILFGKELNTRFYHDVIEACALTDDLSILPAGDQTEVGENGVTLSGGQKARIALARAVYMDKEVYLLDDPLAAVDADVANHLMEKCMLGILKHKTRILCTHRIEFLEKADVIVLMDDGKIVRTGTPAEILPLVEAVPKTRKKDEKRKEKGREGEEEEVEEKGEEDLSGAEPPLVCEEEKKVGAVALQVYSSYWRAVGGCLAFSVLLSLFLMQASRNVSDWWLSNWISSLKSRNHSISDFSLPELSPQLLLFLHGGLVSPVGAPEITAVRDSNSSDVKFYLIVYGAIAAANTIFTAARAFLFAYGAICAATVIHNRILQRVLKATVSFFDMTPIGRIVNRFSSDLYCVDDTLPFILNIFLANLYGLLGLVVVISYGLPWITLLLAPLTLLYYFIQCYYRCTSRELKRLYSVTLSPIYTHFSETLTGLSTIRASRAAARFEEENENRLELNQRCLFASNSAMQWLDIRLQMIGVAVVTAIAVIAVVQHQMKAVDPGLVGLALSYALSVTNLLSGLISSFTQTETLMVSVERMEEYSTEVPTEPQESTIQVAPDWPNQGYIEFQNAALVYRAGLPNALDGVQFSVRPGEKVGIVGRTGSGKSTMFLALFRMVELSSGRILIDSVDTQLVGLEELRSKLAIIPQDPFLFSGTVRENLDPWGRHSDTEIYEVLGQCHLQEVIIRMGGLDVEVGERGRSLSVGQRQLVCLARALLTQSKILCIDEATASVDQKTDRLIQQTIREKFVDKTVLTIAHRLNTIMDSDRVLVMYAGKAVEFDSPKLLAGNSNSLFYRLVQGGHS
ncbi:ATP-binding cassette sub-family C member 10 [Latimeria chalumnae]|uniref:ATP-binding cassette sub-family C member 10 n=1 Tax=Latimeria chalumnae TaxID=7897 RepID=UPI00313BF1B1